MSELINSKELTELFNYYYFVLEQEAESALDNAINAATKCNEAAPGWIPVTEKLPSREGLMDDEHEYVLVCERLSTGGSDVSVCGYTRDGWSYWDSFGSVHPERITHWMPLPESPKEG